MPGPDRRALLQPSGNPPGLPRGVDQLLNKGNDGAGQTIVIFDSFDSPTIASDLQSFDAGYGLPAPPSFTILSPLGTVPYDPTASPEYE